MNEEKYTFTYESGAISSALVIDDADLNVDEMVEQFENFLLATGYRLRAGCRIGIIEPTAPKHAPDDDEDEARGESEEALLTIGRYLEGISRDAGHGSPFKFSTAAASGMGAAPF